VESLSPEIVNELKHSRATRERKPPPLAVFLGLRTSRCGPRRSSRQSPDAAKWSHTRAQEHLSIPPKRFLESHQTSGSHSPRPSFVYASKNLADKPGIAKRSFKIGIARRRLLVPVVQRLSALGMSSAAGRPQARVSDSLALASALEHLQLGTADQKICCTNSTGSAIDVATLGEACREAELTSSVGQNPFATDRQNDAVSPARAVCN